MKNVIQVLSFTLFVTLLFCACSEKEVAGGITDIDHSITVSGVVLDSDGKAVPSARVVAYIDNSISVDDSVETQSDKNGKYQLVLKERTEKDTVVLFAEQGTRCGIANLGAEEYRDVRISSRKSLKGSMNGSNSGYVRVKGTTLKAEIAEDGSFAFDAVPSGEEVILQYVQDDNAVATYTVSIPDSVDEVELPAMIEILLEMDGSERVFDNDSTAAENVTYVDGINGKAISLAPGQFIEIDSMGLTDGDFTISLWTKWEGTNGNHQILVSQRSYWSDSTSKFQWHYEAVYGNFTVMKSAPVKPDDIVFGDSSIVPVGEWSFLTLVSENHNVTMYVNGKQVGETSPFEANKLDVYVPFRIGGNEIDAETWNGLISDVRIESVARSKDWVKNEYQSVRNTL